MGRLLVAGEPGNQIVAALAPVEGESSSTSRARACSGPPGLHEGLQAAGIYPSGLCRGHDRSLRADSMREANDRGYECLLIEEATESYFPEFKASTLEMIVAQGGIVGWVGRFGISRQRSHEGAVLRMEINEPATLAQLLAVFAAYEAALSPTTWRRCEPSSSTNRRPFATVSPTCSRASSNRAPIALRIPGRLARELRDTVITTYGTISLGLDVVLSRPPPAKTGRQMQTWIRTPMVAHRRRPCQRHRLSRLRRGGGAMLKRTSAEEIRRSWPNASSRGSCCRARRSTKRLLAGRV